MEIQAQTHLLGIATGNMKFLLLQVAALTGHQYF